MQDFLNFLEEKITAHSGSIYLILFTNVTNDCFLNSLDTSLKKGCVIIRFHSPFYILNSQFSTVAHREPYAENRAPSYFFP